MSSSAHCVAYVSVLLACGSGVGVCSAAMLHEFAEQSCVGACVCVCVCAGAIFGTAVMLLFDAVLFGAL